jgi:hypothetical protein
LRRLVAQLADEGRRLSMLRYDGLDVPGRLAASLHSLAAPERRALRRLSRAGRGSVRLEQVAAVLGVDPVRAGDVIGRLVEAHLVAEHTAPDGEPVYLVHELVRLFASQGPPALGDAGG